MKQNPNRGTARGRKAIRASLSAYGAGRSILTDRHGEIIAGHHTAEAADQAGLRRRVIDTTGDELVVVRRTDLAAGTHGDARAAGLALADNRTGELNLRWDPARLLSGRELIADGKVRLFAPVEIAALESTAARTPPVLDEADPDGPDTVRLPLDPGQHRRWYAWVARLATLFPAETAIEGRVAAAIEAEVDAA